MKHIKKFTDFKINEEKEIGFFDWIIGDKDDNKVVNQLITRLKKVDPYNNPYSIKELPWDQNWSPMGSRTYEVEFDDMTVKIQWYESDGPSSRMSSTYNIWFKSTLDDDDYESMRPRKPLIKSLFKIVDKLYQTKTKKSAKNYLNKAADLL